MHNKPHTEAAKAKLSAARKGKHAPWKQRPTKLADGVTTYRCGRCLEFLPRESFHSSKRNSLGIRAECRACHSKVSIASRDKDRVRAANRHAEANRRARKAGSQGFVSASDWSDVLRILGSRCLCCGSVENLTQDHVTPLSKGGLHHPTNLQPLCRPCNERKQARMHDYRTDEQRAELWARWVVSFERVEVAQ